MKNLIYTISLLMMFILAACGSKNEQVVSSGSVEFKAKWTPGEEHKFKIDRVIRQWEDTAKIKDFTSSFTAEFRVLERTDSSYKISWSFDPNSLLYLFPEVNREKLDKIKAPEIVYMTNAAGEYANLVNADEIGTYVKKMFEVLLEKPEKETDAESWWRENLKAYKDIYSSREGIESAAISEVLAFHDVFGGKLEMHRPVNITNKVVNPVSGSLVRQYGTTELVQLDTLNKTCVINVTSEIDTSDMAKAMGELFDQTSKELSPEEAKLYKTALIQNLHFRQEEKQKMEFKYDPGLPLKLEFNKKTDYNLGSTHKAAEEKMVIQLVE